MSKFYCEIFTERDKSVSRTGHRNISTHIRGWGKGIYIDASLIDGVETYSIYETGGSNNPSKTLITTIVDE